MGLFSSLLDEHKRKEKNCSNCMYFKSETRTCKKGDKTDPYFNRSKPYEPCNCPYYSRFIF